VHPQPPIALPKPPDASHLPAPAAGHLWIVAYVPGKGWHWVQVEGPVGPVAPPPGSPTPPIAGPPGAGGVQPPIAPTPAPKPA